MTTRVVDIEVLGLDKLVRQFGATKVNAAMDRARDTFVDRIVDRPGRGLGAQRNQLTSTINPMGARILSTLNYPRQTGSAWQRKNQGIANAMAPRVVDRAISDLESGFKA